MEVCKIRTGNAVRVFDLIGGHYMTPDIDEPPYDISKKQFTFSFDGQMPPKIGSMVNGVLYSALVALAGDETQHNPVTVRMAQMQAWFGVSDNELDIKYFRRQLRLAASVLCTVHFEYDTVKMKFFTAIDVRRTKVVFDFDAKFLQYYLAPYRFKSTNRAFCRWFPLMLLPLSRQDSLAFYLGNYISNHALMHATVKNKKRCRKSSRDNSDKLSVASLLGCSNDLKSYADDTAHWRRGLQRPLMNALDHLKACGLLSSWEFTRNGVLVSNAEALNLDYKRFTALVIRFRLNLSEEDADDG